MENTQTKVESFLNESSFITFAISKKPFIISFHYYDKDYITFCKMENYPSIKEYFANRKIKFVIKTDYFETVISLVDTKTGDTLNLRKPKFINGDIDRFFAVKPPENSKFQVLIMGREKDSETVILPEPLLDANLEIHGYSVNDRRFGL